MRADKYYGTNIMYYPSETFTEKYGKNYHNQWRIVCKAKSMTEANRIALQIGLYKNTFNRNYTCETGNKLEIELCNKFGFIVATDGTMGRNYVDIKEMLR